MVPLTAPRKSWAAAGRTMRERTRAVNTARSRPWFFITLPPALIGEVDAPACVGVLYDQFDDVVKCCMTTFSQFIRLFCTLAAFSPWILSTLVRPIETIGGVDGRVLRVTTLAASGPGSLDAALRTEGPRLVVFEVGGVIELGGRTLVVRSPHLTIAGQTAPDPGITLIRGGLIVETHDVVIQHLAVRPGDDGPAGKEWAPDAL